MRALWNRYRNWWRYDENAWKETAFVGWGLYALNVDRWVTKGLAVTMLAVMAVNAFVIWRSTVDMVRGRDERHPFIRYEGRVYTTPRLARILRRKRREGQA